MRKDFRLLSPFLSKSKVLKITAFLPLPVQTASKCIAASKSTATRQGNYNLTKDTIIYVWDVQRHEQTIKAEKERKNQLTAPAAV